MSTLEKEDTSQLKHFLKELAINDELFEMYSKLWTNIESNDGKNDLAQFLVDQGLDDETVILFLNKDQVGLRNKFNTIYGSADEVPMIVIFVFPA